MSNIQELINRKPGKWGNVSIKEFNRDIKHLQEECKYLMEESDYLIKIRDDLSELEFEPGTKEFAVAKPEGIYKMVMELKEELLAYREGRVVIED